MGNSSQKQREPGLIAVKRLFASPRLSGFTRKTVSSPHIHEVYGELAFPDVPAHRPYCCCCFVSSADGGIRFPDTPDGTQVARRSRSNPDGAASDFWLLNLLRSASDAVVIGGNTLRSDPRMSGRVLIPELLDARIQAGLPQVPLQIIPTKGDAFPAGHPLFREGNGPVLVVSTQEGMDSVAEKLSSPFRMLDGDQDPPADLAEGGLQLAAFGTDAVDIRKFHRYLRAAGISQVLTESPRYASELMNTRMADELFLTLSSVFIGGVKEGFIPELRYPAPGTHPEGSLLSVHIHGEEFLFLRYSLNYHWT